MGTRKKAVAPIEELRVEIHFEGLRSVPVVMVCEILERVDDLVGQAERQDLLFFRSEFPEVPAAVFDAAEHRMTSFASHVDLDGLREGSIILELTPSSIALGMVALAATEVFKDAWKQSGLHRKPVDLLSRSLTSKADLIAKEAKGMPLYKTEQAFHTKPTVDAQVAQRNSAVVASITVKADENIYQAATPVESLAAYSNPEASADAPP